MAIYRDGSEIRIERSERLAKGGGYFLFVGMTALSIYFLSMADRVTDWLIAAGFFATGAVLLLVSLKRKQVCIIRPDQIGYGSLGGKMYWIERAPIVGVRVVDGLLLQVRCIHADGISRESITLTDFDPAELREAFEEAGLPVQ